MRGKDSLFAGFAQINPDFALYGVYLGFCRFLIMPTHSYAPYHIAIAAFCLCLTILSAGIPFFWDNVLLVSKIAHHYYEHGLGNLILPNALDSGHPPFYPLYVSLWWKVLGRSLWVSHLAALPFMCLMAWAYFALVRLLLPRAIWWFALLLLAIEPAVLAQSVMGAIDLPLVAGHLWAIWALLQRRRGVLALAVGLMCAVSLRGIIASVLLLATACLWQLVLYAAQLWRSGVLQRATPPWAARFLVALEEGRGLATLAAWGMSGVLLLAIGWYNYHYTQTGFWVHNPQSAWATAPDNHYYESATIGQAFWHVAIVVWRTLDQGRVAFWLLLGYVLIQMQRKGRLAGVWSATDKQWLIWLFVPWFLYVGIVVLRNNPIMTRYFLSYFLLFQLWVLRCWVQSPATQSPVSEFWYLGGRRRIAAGLTAILLSGHAWIYPYPISNSWDTTLAYLPYFSAQRQLFDYARAKQLPYAEVGSAFPLFSASKFVYLTDDTLHFTDKIKRPLRDFPYIAYTNISNEFSPQNLLRIEEYFETERQFECAYARVVLYKRKQTLSNP